MKTIDELTAAVESAEAASEQVAAIGYLQAKLAGVKSRYKAFGVAVPAEVAALDTDLTDALTETKMQMAKGAPVEAVAVQAEKV